MNIITIRREDADYWESLLKEKSVSLEDRGLQKNTILAKWSVRLGWGVTAWLNVGSGTDTLSAWMEWNRGGTFIVKSTPVRRTLLGEWTSPDGNKEDDVKVLMVGVDPGEPEAGRDNPLLTFEEGRRLAESGEAKPDYAGDILFDKKYGVYPLCITGDGELQTSPTSLLDKWDFYLGVLCGLGYTGIVDKVVFCDKFWTFDMKLIVNKPSEPLVDLSTPHGRHLLKESVLLKRGRCRILNKMLHALRDSTPPYLHKLAISVMLRLTDPEERDDGTFVLYDADRVPLRFEIYRNVLLRLDEDDQVEGVGADALFIPASLPELPKN